MVEQPITDTRRRIMAAIRSKDTKPELLIRRGLHAMGFRYRLHDKKLPGRPDLVLPKWKAIIFINGCFWHGHEDCHIFKLPKTRSYFWEDKINKNRNRDDQNHKALLAQGWRILDVWECAIQGTNSLPLTLLLQEISVWLKSNGKKWSIRSK